MLVVTRGMVRAMMARRLDLSVTDRREGIERRMRDVAREMAGQPSVEGDSEHAEPHAEAIFSEPLHGRARRLAQFVSPA